MDVAIAPVQLDPIGPIRLDTEAVIAVAGPGDPVLNSRRKTPAARGDCSGGGCFKLFDGSVHD